MSVSPLSMAIGVASSVVVCVIAWRLRALSVSGCAAGVAVGTIIMGMGGVAFAAPLVVFFVTSSAWSRWKRADRGADRGQARDASQVIANGGVAALIVLVAAAMPPEGRPTTRDWFLIYVGALAFANADTWGTEVGSKLSRSARLITDWSKVGPGTSGGISLVGTLAALMGSAIVVLSAYAVWPIAATTLQWRMDLAEGLAVTWAGFMGSLADSLLGAAIQAQYGCSKCGRRCEEPEHCGMPARLVRGVRWFGNGAVNFAASIAAAGCAWYLLRAFAWPAY